MRSEEEICGAGLVKRHIGIGKRQRIGVEQHGPIDIRDRIENLA